MIRRKLTAWLTVNRACNLRCNWCYAKMTRFDKADNMTIDTVERSIKLLKNLGISSVIIIGGEPTLHPRFLEIVKIIRDQDMNCYLVTNALMFSDKYFLAESVTAGLSSITISFKASSREKFTADTGVDAFEKACEAISNIVNSGINHVLNITACENLTNDLDEMIKVVKRLGVKSFSIDTGKPIFIDGKSYSDGMISPERIAQFFREADSKLKNSSVRYSLKVAIPFCLFPKDFINHLIADGNIMTGCQMVGGNGIIIDPHGRIIPCNHICDLSLGEVGNNLETAEDYERYREKEEIKHFYQVVGSCPDERCVDCPYWKDCGAGCRLYWLHYQQDDLMGNFERKEVKRHEL